jgi:hypothetical protein
MLANPRLWADDGLTGSYVFTFSGGLRRRCAEVGFEDIVIDLLQARLNEAALRWLLCGSAGLHSVSIFVR